MLRFNSGSFKQIHYIRAIFDPIFHDICTPKGMAAVDYNLSDWQNQKPQQSNFKQIQKLIK